MKFGQKTIDNNEICIWGILNTTPDSFSDGGSFNDLDRALFRAEEMMKEGAGIIDVGGMSTRPGHEEISEQEETDRVCPVIQAIKERLDTIVSVDTYRASVAEQSALAGADIINDIWGLKWDTNMAELVKKYDLGVCIMHNNKTLMEDATLIQDCLKHLEESLLLAKNAGIPDEAIILDPGVGFAKTTEQNLAVMKHLAEFRTLGYPVLLGTSRKSMIGNTLKLSVDQREEGTIATTLYGLAQGITHFRVHDVVKNKRAIDMWLAMENADKYLK